MCSVRRLTASRVVMVRRFAYAAQRREPHSGQWVATGLSVWAWVGGGRLRRRDMTRSSSQTSLLYSTTHFRQVCQPRKKVVSAAQQRAAAGYLTETYQISQRRACRVLDC